MLPLPLYITVTFIVTALVAFYLLAKAASFSTKLIVIISAWLAAQGLIAMTGFYTITNALPPRFILVTFPALLLIIFLFTTEKGRQFIDIFSIKYLLLLSSVRLAVEIVLYWLSVQGKIPQLMTFEGRNFDIFSGLTAPLLYYAMFIRKKFNPLVFLGWNIICLLLLINIVVHAVLSAPFPIQQMAFGQPNVAVLYFPFVWLPGFIVPAVLFSHIAMLRAYIMAQKKQDAPQNILFS